MAEQRIVLDESGGKINGFMSLRSDGYIDFTYIRPSTQGTGLFRRLYEAEASARKESFSPMGARQPDGAAGFSAVGFDIVKKEDVELGGEMFERFEMARGIGKDAS